MLIQFFLHLKVHLFHKWSEVIKLIFSFLESSPISFNKMLFKKKKKKSTSISGSVNKLWIDKLWIDKLWIDKRTKYVIKQMFGDHS